MYSQLLAEIYYHKASESHEYWIECENRTGRYHTTTAVDFIC
eukprot:COSAG01_NODE_62263_length_285_cov_1.118280_1_plen_41_part_10